MSSPQHSSSPPTSATAPAAGPEPPCMVPLYKDPNQSVEARVRDLLSRMTLEEKVAQMAQIERSVTSPETITELSMGSVLNGGGRPPKEGATPEDWVNMTDQLQRWAMASRLGIPIIYGVDAVHGHNNVIGATIFPHNIGLGAARDPDLVRRIGEATALEVRATGIQYAFAPCVAVCRDPRWGRCYESYSEDTSIVCQMTSLVSGLQGTPPKGHPSGYPFLASSNNVIACAKHFVGDGGTKKGKNEDDTICSFEKLEEIHMKPYLDCLSQGVSTVMASYSSWNGIKLHSHRFLITEILKEKLGFMGFVISDWEAIDHLSQPYGSDYKLCVSGSINAGIDMVMVPFRYKEFLDNLICLVKSGEIPISRIDDAVQRILRVKFVAGLFEHPFSDRSLLKFVGCKEHRQLACEAVRKSIVLLKNGKESEKPFLPLNRSAGDILIAGTHAHDIGYLCGGWTIAWGGGKGPITTGTTILDAITKTAGKHVGITYEEFPAETTFEDKQFSYAIVAVGEVPYSESVGDRSYLDIQLQGAEIVKYVSSKLPTLVILISGRPLLLEPELLDNVDAVVAAWLPGTEAEGIADVLFGDYEFEGVLPMTWFKRMDQLPINAGQEIYDPLFPLGYGLKMNVGAHEAD